MKGFFCNDDIAPFPWLIALGMKDVETRSKNMLSALVGERVAIVKTGRNSKPLVIGFVTITGAAYLDSEWLEENRNRTHIPAGSKFDTGARWCYFLEDAETIRRYELPDNAIRHGRSWCEF